MYIIHNVEEMERTKETVKCYSRRVYRFITNCWYGENIVTINTRKVAINL